MTEPSEPAPLDPITQAAVDACSEVHRRLGPGLPGETYAEALSVELSHHGIGHQRNVLLPVFYRGVRLGASYHLPLCVDRTVLVQVLAVPLLTPAHRVELRAHLRASGLDAGVLANFHAPRLVDGLVVLRRTAGSTRAGVRAALARLDEPTQAPPPPPANGGRTAA